MHSIELLLDEAADQRVRDEWAALAAADLPSLADHAGASNAPHVTLLARPVVDPRHDEALAALLGELLPLPLATGAPLVFGRPGRGGRGGWVLARSVVPTAALLDLHRRVHELASGEGDVPHTAPGAWSPHVTLAHRLTATTLARALEVLADEEARVASPPTRASSSSDVAAAARRWDSDAREVVALGPVREA